MDTNVSVPRTTTELRELAESVLLIALMMNTSGNVSVITDGKRMLMENVLRTALNIKFMTIIHTNVYAHTD